MKMRVLALVLMLFMGGRGMCDIRLEKELFKGRSGIQSHGNPIGPPPPPPLPPEQPEQPEQPEPWIALPINLILLKYQLTWLSQLFN